MISDLHVTVLNSNTIRSNAHRHRQKRREIGVAACCLLKSKQQFPANPETAAGGTWIRVSNTSAEVQLGCQPCKPCRLLLFVQLLCFEDDPDADTGFEGRCTWSLTACGHV